MDRVGQDHDLLEELVALFLEDLDARLAGISEALEADDLDLMHERTHSLKGSVANFAAPAAFEAARRADDLARSGQREGLAEAVEALVGQVRRLGAELEELVKGA